MWKWANWIWSKPVLPCQIPDPPFLRLRCGGMPTPLTCWHLHKSLALQPTQAFVTVSYFYSTFQWPWNESQDVKPEWCWGRECVCGALYMSVHFHGWREIASTFCRNDLTWIGKHKVSTWMWFIFPAVDVFKLIFCPKLLTLICSKKSGFLYSCSYSSPSYMLASKPWHPCIVIN